MNTKKHSIHLLLPALLLCVIPLPTLAAKIYVNNLESPASVGAETILKIMIDTEGKEINAVEGTVIVGKPATVTSIDESGSVFGLWARKPSLVANKISFAGGTTAGVYGSTLKVFTVHIKPLQLKPVKVTFDNVSMYLNDGKGTKISVLGRQADISVNASGTAPLTQESTVDTESPASFSVDLGKDPALYDGKYFISFFALDKESGISSYEVTESGYPPVRSGNTYVLQNQKLSGTIVVKATDKSGNVRIEKINLNPGTTMVKTIVSVIGIIILGVIGRYLFLLKKR